MRKFAPLAEAPFERPYKLLVLRSNFTDTTKNKMKA